MSTNDGGPAFPVKDARVYDSLTGETFTPNGFNGISARDYFAASVIEGIMLNSIMLKSGNPTQWANDAYAVADAMLAAREAK